MDYKQANITYKGLTDSKLTVTLLDSEGKKWQIWKKDYNNPEQDSEAYSSLQNFKFGETFGVSYGEKEDSFENAEGKIINFTRRTIYSIMPVINEADVSPATPKPAPQAPTAEVNKSQYSETRDEFGRRLAIHGFVNGMLASGVKPEDINRPEIEMLMALEELINARLALPYPLSDSIDNPLDVSDIPF